MTGHGESPAGGITAHGDTATASHSAYFHELRYGQNCPEFLLGLHTPIVHSIGGQPAIGCRIVSRAVKCQVWVVALKHAAGHTARPIDLQWLWGHIGGRVPVAPRCH